MVARDWIGWTALSFTEQLSAIAGGVLFLWAYLSGRALFGGLFRRLPSRRPPAKPKPEARRKAAGKGRR